MRSIRLSLVLYFLGLLCAALGAVSYFSYQSIQNALEAKEQSTKTLLTKKFKEDETDILAKFDEKVLDKGRALGQKFVLYYHRVEPLYILGVIANGPQNGGLFNLLPYAEAVQPSLTRRVSQMRSDPRLQQVLHSDDEHVPDPVVDEGEYYQTYFIPNLFPFKGDVSRRDLHAHEAAPMLGGLVWQLDKDKKKLADDAQRPFDHVTLKSGQTIRRVTLRFPLNTARLGLALTPIPPLTEKNYPSLPPAGKDVAISQKGRPYIYLQFGMDTAPRDAAVGKLKAALDADVVNLTNELENARTSLGKQLLWIGLGTFTALVFGGLWLVRIALSPLDRLSDAVSKVSEKDFRLPINQNRLPPELKPIAGRLAETLEQLKRAFEREKQAAADISHELRTPVAALLTTLEITLRKPRSAEEYREVLEDCRNSGQQINRLVERLLKLARLDAGADLLRPREVDVAALADQCVALVRPLAEARGLQLRMHHNGPASLQADPDKLREVLTNLLHNAIEYNKPDGSIDVQVERTNGTLALEVRDTGIGISPEARQRIFERFFRADCSRHSDDSPHAGLGLAIVKGYVDLMGGAIDVDSTVGQGSTFRVRLPVL